MAKRSRKTKKRGRKAKRLSKSDMKFHKALCVLKSMNKSDRTQAIANANGNFIRKVSSAVRKLRYRPFSGKRRNKLRTYRKQLRQLANSKTSITSKRRVLSQKGGFLPALLPLLAPLAAPIIGPIVKKIVG